MNTIHVPLPPELWLDISSYLERLDHLSLVQVNRRFNQIFIPALYSDIIIKGPDYYIMDGHPVFLDSPDAASRFFLAGRTRGLLERLQKDAELRQCVRQCKISTFRAPFRDMTPSEAGQAPYVVFETLVEDIFQLVATLPSLERVKIHLSEIPAQCFFMLCQLPDIDITTSAVTMYGKVDLSEFTSFKVGRLVFETSNVRPAIPSIVEMTLSGSLRELSLNTESRGVLKKLFTEHMQRSTPSLPLLEVLEIGWIDAQYFDFFRATPNLLELRLKGITRLQLGTSTLNSDLLPRLRRFSGHHSLLPCFVRGRPVMSITTRDTTGTPHPDFWAYDDNITLSPLGMNFGSSTPVLKLVWVDCTRNRELLQYLVDRNPGILHLDVTPTVPYTKVLLSERLDIVEQLKQLRELYIRSLQHVPSTDSLLWEKETCERLRRKGSAMLTSVSFSTLIDWTRKVDSELWTPSGEGLPVYRMYMAKLQPIASH